MVSLERRTGRSIEKHHDRAWFSIYLTIYVEVPEEELMNRLTGRRICETCGATYHLKPTRLRQRVFVT